MAKFTVSLSLLLSFFVLLLSFSLADSKNPNDDINHFILTMTWPPNFCKVVSCMKPPPGVNLPYNFTIHGLWPQKAPTSSKSKPFDTSYNKCKGTYDSKNIAGLVNDLREKWPQLSDMRQAVQYWFWRHEWLEHGTCTVPMFNTTTYFKHTMSLYDRFDSKKILRDAGISPGKTGLTAQAVRSAFSGKVEIKEPFVHCIRPQGGGSSLFLVELYFCLERDATTFIDCKTIYGFDNDCRQTFTFMDPTDNPPEYYPLM